MAAIRRSADRCSDRDIPLLLLQALGTSEKILSFPQALAFDVSVLDYRRLSEH